MEQLIDILHSEGCSCVVRNGDEIRLFHRRGVMDLYLLLRDETQLLEGADIADKIIGKGAAALMILGGVGRVYTDVISQAALELFEKSGVEVEYGGVVSHIINRTGTGLCPVERLCAECATAEECLPLIEEFVKSLEQ